MNSFTSREFNQGTGAANKAALDGLVYLANRGQPTHVLLSYDHYRELVGARPNIIDILGAPPGIADIDFRDSQAG